MYRIYTRSGDLVRWAPSFSNEVEAWAWVALHGDEQPWEVEEFEDWHSLGHEACHHPWYSRPYEGDEVSHYRSERNWLKSLAPDTITQCLNGEPTTAEERIDTVEDILATWHGVYYH